MHKEDLQKIQTKRNKQKTKEFVLHTLKMATDRKLIIKFLLIFSPNIIALVKINLILKKNKVVFMVGVSNLWIEFYNTCK